MIDQPFAKQAIQHIFLHTDKPCGASEQLRLVVPQPHDFAERRHRMNRRACAQIDCMAIQLVANPVRPFARAVVGPGDAVGQKTVVAVERDHAMHCGTERHQGDPVISRLRSPSCLDRLGNRGQYRLINLLRILFRHARRRTQQWIFHRVLGNHTPFQGEHYRFGTGGADIDAEHEI